MRTEDEELEALKAAAAGARGRMQEAGTLSAPKLEPIAAPAARALRAVSLPPAPAPRQPNCRVCETPLEKWGTCESCKRHMRLGASYSMLPASFAWCTLRSPDLYKRIFAKKALAQGEKARDEPRVVFTGPAGSGKTSLACAILRDRFVEKDEGFLFQPAYLLALARQRHKLGEGEPPEIEASLQVDVLLIDDLGMEKPGPTSVNDIEIVIYERHLRGQSTWITTWMGREKVRERYGDGIARRIYEDATLIDCGAK